MVFAHLTSVAVQNGAAINSLGVIVGYSGCSGNAAATNCGQDGPTDGRTDHVHVQVYVTEAGKTKIVDPKTELVNWTLKTPK